MSRRSFATVDAVLVVLCIFIFAGGVLARPHASGDPARADVTTAGAGDRR